MLCIVAFFVEISLDNLDSIGNSVRQIPMYTVSLVKFSIRSKNNTKIKIMTVNFLLDFVIYLFFWDY